MPLNDTEILVLATKTMKFTEEEALEYLKKKGHPMKHAAYYRTLGRMSAETKKRIYEIAKNLQESHLEKLDTLHRVESEYWDIYKSTNTKVITSISEAKGTDKHGNPIYTKKTRPEIIQIPLEADIKVNILQKIADIQEYISQYEEATRDIIEDTVRIFGKEEKQIDLSGLGV